MVSVESQSNKRQRMTVSVGFIPRFFATDREVHSFGRVQGGARILGDWLYRVLKDAKIISQGSVAAKFRRGIR